MPAIDAFLKLLIRAHFHKIHSIWQTMAALIIWIYIYLHIVCLTELYTNIYLIVWALIKFQVGVFYTITLLKTFTEFVTIFIRIIMKQCNYICLRSYSVDLTHFFFKSHLWETIYLIFTLYEVSELI